MGGRPRHAAAGQTSSTKQALGVVGRGVGRLIGAVLLVVLGLFLVAAGLSAGSGDYLVESVLCILGLVCFAGAWDVLRGK
jgi:hypothetical protein